MDPNIIYWFLHVVLCDNNEAFPGEMITLAHLSRTQQPMLSSTPRSIPGPLSPIPARSVRACAPTAQQQFMPLRQQRWPSAFPGTTRAPLAKPPHPRPPSPILATRPRGCATEAQQQFMPLRQQRWPSAFSGTTCASKPCTTSKAPSPVLARSVRACVPTAQQQFMPLRPRQASAWGPGNHLRLEALHHIPVRGRDATCAGAARGGVS